MNHHNSNDESSVPWLMPKKNNYLILFSAVKCRCLMPEDTEPETTFSHTLRPVCQRTFREGRDFGGIFEMMQQY